MAKITIEFERCKGCLLCTKACPQKILAQNNRKLNHKGSYPIEVIDPKKCIGCAMCAMMCPDCVITVEK